MSVDEADTLRSLLTKKEAEMKEMEEKYKKYLEKARTVSRHSGFIWELLTFMQSEVYTFIIMRVYVS